MTLKLDLADTFTPRRRLEKLPTISTLVPHRLAPLPPPLSRFFDYLFRPLSSFLFFGISRIFVTSYDYRENLNVPENGLDVFWDILKSSFFLSFELGSKREHRDLLSNRPNTWLVKNYNGVSPITSLPLENCDPRFSFTDQI